MITIEQLTAEQAESIVADLAGILRDSVAGGASVGFLPPLELDDARGYWSSVIGDMVAGALLLLVARQEGSVVGTVQIALAQKPNARHRAEVQKLMVHSHARRRGIGQALLAAADDAARQAGRTLLVLDTRAGDPSELLYLKHGYTCAGVIAEYARSADGALDATAIFYRLLV